MSRTLAERTIDKEGQELQVERDNTIVFSRKGNFRSDDGLSGYYFKLSSGITAGDWLIDHEGKRYYIESVTQEPNEQSPDCLFARVEIQQPAAFKDILEQLFAETKTTAYKLFKETGISQGLLSNYKSGRSRPTRDNAVKIAKFFGVSVDRLSGTEQPPIENNADGEKPFTDEDLKFALWGDAKDEITEDDMNDIRAYAQFVAERKKRKRDVESEKPQ